LKKRKISSTYSTQYAWHDTSGLDGTSL